MSLDTKYRPRKFDDVLGQDSIITILRRYIVTGRSLHQSYLFAGPFGSGKTTLGRIMARALMCETPTPEGDPCDLCASCTSILETGNSIDFVEVDAATNSGKADVQKITEEIQYSAFAGRRRIYLFDEAHQLSKDALDALLKPLEETIPGTQEKRLVCIFCTTEPEKMKATIFSRCAPTFVIQPVKPIDIATRLAYVCDQEGFEYELPMLQVIAEMVESHIRDALKAVEGVSMLGPLNRDNVAKYLKLDMNLMFIDILERLGKDLNQTMAIAKEAMLRSSPATCYEKLAAMAMLSYQVGLGAIKPPSYIEEGRLEGLFASQGHSLLGFASRFASRLGRPTESMLLCDLGALHFGGGQVGQSSQVVVIQQVAAPAIPTMSGASPSPQEKMIAPSTIGGKMPIAPVSPGAGTKRADVRVNPKARSGNHVAPPSSTGPRGPLPTMDAQEFAKWVAVEVAQSEGNGSGSTGRNNMGGD